MSGRGGRLCLGCVGVLRGRILHPVHPGAWGCKQPHPGVLQHLGGTLGCCTPEGRVRVCGAGGSPATPAAGFERVQSFPTAGTGEGLEEGDRKPSGSCWIAAQGCHPARGCPQGLGAQLQSQRVQPSTRLSPNPVFSGRGVVRMGSQQLGTQSEQAMAVPKSLRNNKKKKRPKQPRCRGAVVWQLPRPPLTPHFSPPAPRAAGDPSPTTDGTRTWRPRKVLSARPAAPPATARRRAGPPRPPRSPRRPSPHGPKILGPTGSSGPPRAAGISVGFFCTVRGEDTDRGVPALSAGGAARPARWLQPPCPPPQPPHPVCPRRLRAPRSLPQCLLSPYFVT